jgi:hypothetical protein
MKPELEEEPKRKESTYSAKYHQRRLNMSPLATAQLLELQSQMAKVRAPTPPRHLQSVNASTSVNIQHQSQPPSPDNANGSTSTKADALDAGASRASYMSTNNYLQIREWDRPTQLQYQGPRTLSAISTTKIIAPQ